MAKNVSLTHLRSIKKFELLFADFLQKDGVVNLQLLQ